jgi:hypothetical protein
VDATAHDDDDNHEKRKLVSIFEEGIWKEEELSLSFALEFINCPGFDTGSNQPAVYM